MKNDPKKSNGRKIGNGILNKLYGTDSVISVTIVGSFNEKFDIDKVGDIDVIVICKKLNKKIISKIQKRVKSLNSLINLKKRKLKINSSFGPIKFDPKKFLTIHLMIYDVESHIQHTINSPFTCYDWERSKWFKGKKLEDIFPVKSIQLRDFFEARRNSSEYLKDIKNGKISIRKYKFKKKKIFLEKSYFHIDKKNRGEFVFHIINYLIINFNKFKINRNIKISYIELKKLFLEITNNNNLWKEFNSLRSKKITLHNKYSNKILILGKRFLKYFNNYIDKEKNKYNHVSFIRHAKTSVNLNEKTFFGQGRDSMIIKTKNNKNSKKIYDFLYCSPLKRALQTSKLFRKKKIYIDKNLNEINYGLAEGMSFKHYSDKFPKKIKAWKTLKDPRFPNGENSNDVKKRILKFIDIKLIKNCHRCKNKKILIITHNVVLRCLIGHYLKINASHWFKLKIKHLENLDFILRNKSFFPNLERTKIKKIILSLYD